ncbi:hypothetical protein NP493_33g02078 [Ridgeia piscesae]|uniref:HMG box domain-containing protein n=1 Tax=Ridgeia piscesae TaxID=27915 RepID=A0AAD9PCV0_RIDPI|nr:hypothetical protein NP493_33g02078 [Ridgeia piscesae]
MASVVGDREASTPAGHKRTRPRQHQPADRGDQPPSKAPQSDADDAEVSPAKKPKLEPSGGSGDHINAEDNSKVEIWSNQNINELLARIKQALPTTDNLKYSTQMDRLDWTTIQFGEYGAEDCKKQWNAIMIKIRRFRTMTELVQDATEWVKCPNSGPNKKWANKPPGMPRKPLTSYFRFFLEKRPKVSKERPDLSMTDLAKFLSEKYRSLPDQKKLKYTEAYTRENEQYKAAYARFKEENPDFFQTHHSNAEYVPKAGGSPPKPTTAVQIYINNKVAEHLKKYPHVSRKQLYELYRKRWSQMVDKKKMKYIKKALEAKEKYDDNMEKYCELNPDYKPKEVKSFLTKAEQKVKDRHSGKPDKPPINGFNLFTSRLIVSNFPSKQRMAEISRRWKALTDIERASFNNDAQKKMAAYNEQYQKYLESLPEEERMALGGAIPKKEESPPGSPDKKGSSKAQAPVERMTKPIAAVFIFMDEKESAYRKKNPKMDKKELSRLMLQDFNSLPAKEKTKYKKMAAQRKEKLAQQNKENAQAQEKTKKVVKLHFPGEPKKPPGSGYHLFSTTMLTSLTHVMHTERMAEIARRWRNMSESEQKAYTTKRDVLHRQHAKALEQFKKGLSPKDLKRYEEYEKAKKTKKPVQQNKTSAKKSKVKTKELESESGSEASDAESSSDSESGSSSESEDAGDSQKPEWAATNGLQKKEGKLQTGDVYGDDDDDDDDDDDESNESVSASSAGESEAESETESDSDD